MLILTLYAVAASAALLIILISYRRQIRKICRQMEFLRAHRTNLLLSEGLPFSELNELTDSINEWVSYTREQQRMADKSSEALKQTITSLSHDIRTPLTSMDGYFQLLAESESEEERQHYLIIIRSRISSLTDMLEELFTFAKLSNHDYVIETETIDFGKTVFDTVFSYYDEWSSKGITPALDFCDETLMIRGNEEAVRRILQNIIRNAMEHGESCNPKHNQADILNLEKQSENDRSISSDLHHYTEMTPISTPESFISMSLKAENDRAVFVCENQVSNPEEIQMGQIFDRFYKADSARTHTSTGLGLSIAKELTERMGGEMSAELENDVFSIHVSFSTTQNTMS